MKELTDLIYIKGFDYGLMHKLLNSYGYKLPIDDKDFQNNKKAIDLTLTHLNRLV